MIPTVEWRDGTVCLLDQSCLPGEVRILNCYDHHMVASAIRDLKVRGAPAIGVAAALGVALAAHTTRATSPLAFAQEMETVCAEFSSTRPTAVNLFWALDRMRRVLHTWAQASVDTLKRLLLKEALRIQEEDLAMNRAIGRHGSTVVADGHQILTHCNAGALATAGYGTALGVVRAAWEQGKRIHVFADETRPVLQGARLTAWELRQEGIPVTVITDNTAGVLMKQRRIDLCLVGADRIAANGDVANKIGTYSLAVLAKAHGVPFYVAAPSSTIDCAIASGEAIPIETRPPHEVTSLYSGTRIAPEGVEVLNLAFDVTPADYITGIITERGIFRPEQIDKVMCSAHEGEFVGRRE
ncbi:MAG: S-methyl-5-thioribose-1-phosphate isomerase [Nitrospirae bacterium]|nr:MAG: S-methyl-5-thioribose-1-phosphate isomerase [Nitrospirota bacterium]